MPNGIHTCIHRAASTEIRTNLNQIGCLVRFDFNLKRFEKFLIGFMSTLEFFLVSRLEKLAARSNLSEKYRLLRSGVE